MYDHVVPPFLLHADADCFFASVAMRAQPHLRDVPMAVVNMVIIASANYPARDVGVRGGMHISEARRMHPSLILVELDGSEVERVGDELFDIFEDEASAVEPASMEEAFLDVGAATGAAAIDAAERLRARTWTEIGIPVSVGIGSSKFVAKHASRAAKPGGVHLIGGAEERRLRAELGPEDIWGVGPRTCERLESLGVRALRDIDGIEPDVLIEVCGRAMARKLRALRDGSDDADVRPVHTRTALSAEVATSGHRRRDWTPGEMLETCLARVCRRADRARLKATGVSVTLFPRGVSGTMRFTLPLLQPSRDFAQLLAGARAAAPRPVPPLTRLRVTLTGLDGERSRR